MSRKYNFYAGPATLPLPVLEQIQSEFLDYKGMGMSLVETSHRSPEYDEVHNKAVSLVKELLGIGDEFSVMMLQGGATMQFSMVPMNLLNAGNSCDFTMTGAWAKKACADAKKIGNVNVVFDGSDANYMTLPEPDALQVDPNAVYLHVTSNETIGGIQWHKWPESGNVPLVADMSSDMMSRPLPMDRFGVIYAGAQKNLGPSGMALVVMRNDLLEKCNDNLTAYMSYKTHAPKNSLYNTPPVFSIWAFGLVMEWVKNNGGLTGMAALNEKKAAYLYDAMETSGGFYNCPVPGPHRSLMNVVWRLPTEELEKMFIAEAKAAGMVGLKGHRSVGGCRASIYNAMPEHGCQALADLMNTFAAKHG